MRNPKTGVSAHVLDTTRGRPAADVPISLGIWTEGIWGRVGGSVTDAGGRVADLPDPGVIQATSCRLIFTVRDYLMAHHGVAFFPEVTVTFVAAPGQHYHLPLLLSPFGYSVYRGS